MIPDGATPATAPVPAGRVSDDGLVLRCADVDNRVRWRPGERLEQLYEIRCDELRARGEGGRLVVDRPGTALTFDDLDGRANQLARHLRAQAQVAPADRVGLLFDDPVDGYVGMLAVLKLGAAYVPLDAAFPADRIAYIAADCEMASLLTTTQLAADLAGLDAGVSVVALDAVASDIDAQPRRRLAGGCGAATVDALCYVIYTSGTTGRPKGVAVTHSSIVNFVRVAADVYGVRADDRVYQGLTIAFDFAVEEIWVAWMAGATLVPRPAGHALLGLDLHDYLIEQRVTALCCVPTLLGTLSPELPDLRFLLVSGEACPTDLVARWHQPGRRMLNVYGPTEATVTATWAQLHPDRPVTIGVPLPTYTILVLDPQTGRPQPVDAEGEIAIAGIGLAEGYLGLPERTAQAFVDDPLDLPDNPSGRIYRTGDLGAVNAAGELEHRGRIDEQVKVRGYRIELGEIEAVLRELPGVDQAVVGVWEPVAGLTELVGYYTRGPGVAPRPAELTAGLRERLPAYMIPRRLEVIEIVPMMPSGKVDRRALPAPTPDPTSTLDAPPTETMSPLQAALAGALAAELGAGTVGLDADVFDELGASSLTMARFVGRVRADPLLPAISIRDVYSHRTLRALAAAHPAVVAPTSASRSASDQAPVLAARGTARPVACATVQAAAFLVYATLVGLSFAFAADWLGHAGGLLALYGRAIALGAATLLASGLVPVAAKWILIGRFDERPITLWSLAYARFWIVKTLLVANPTARLIVGTPLYRPYLRLLGARVGPGAVILSRHLPVAADLIEIGGGAIVRKEVWFNGYRAREGRIECGAVRIGRDAVVSEQVVLDIDTVLGDRAQIGHASSLRAGQRIPDGECWHGSPAAPAPAGCDYRFVARPEPAGPRRRRAVVYSAGRLSFLLGIVAPAEASLAVLLAAHTGAWAHVGAGELIVLAALITLALPAAGLLVAATVPRLLSHALTPGRVYPVYGLHWALQRTIWRAANILPLCALFGDSALATGYLRLLGYRLGMVRQTGSNVGMEVKHELPALCSVGTGAMISDGLSVANLEVSASGFRVVPAAIGDGAYLGNLVTYPAGARVGDDCLLATKVMVPLHGPIREGVGLLGSPCLEIPRSVSRDTRRPALDPDDPRLSLRLRAKLRHNVVTIGLHLGVRFLITVGLLALAWLPLRAGGVEGLVGITGSVVAELALPAVVFVLAELALTRARRRPPALCSLYDRSFWEHERYWKVPAPRYLNVFNGTALKGPVLRLLGVRVGPRLYDDGAALVERTLVTLGADCTLNAGCSLHGHSLEEGVFKSGPLTFGDRCSVGTGALVHYDTRLGDDVQVAADSFVMKGSVAPDGSVWVGNPAAEESPTAALAIPTPEVV